MYACFSCYCLIIQITVNLMKHLDYWINFKKVIAKVRKGAAFWKQSLYNTLIKMLYFVISSILLAVLASFKLLPMRMIAYHVCFFYFSCLWHWWIQDPCSIYSGALCNKCQQLEAITTTKSSIFYVVGVIKVQIN